MAEASTKEGVTEEFNAKVSAGAEAVVYGPETPYDEERLAQITDAAWREKAEKAVLEAGETGEAIGAAAYHAV